MPPGTPLDRRNAVVAALSPTDLWVPADNGGRNLCRGGHCDTKQSQVSIGPSPHGLSIVGSGIDSTSTVSGFESANGAVDYTGASALTMFALVSFASSRSSDVEVPLLRLDSDGASNNAQCALDIFQTGTGYVIRPLIATSGTTGWSISNDVTLSNPVFNMPYLIVATYNPAVEAGIRVFVGPAGGAVVSLKNGSSAVTGTVSVLGGSTSSMSMHLGGMAYTGAGILRGWLLYAGVATKGISATLAQQWLNNPWQLFRP